MKSTIAGESRVLAVARRVALVIVALLIVASTLVSFAESYRAEYEWALHHSVPSGWALIWPMMVDAFTFTGECVLFVALLDRWTTRQRAYAWCIVAAGLLIGIGANVGHVQTHALTDRATASLPPVAAAAALTVGLGLLKRMASQGTTAEAAEQAATELLPVCTPDAIAAPEDAVQDRPGAVGTVEVTPLPELPTDADAPQTIEERATEAFGDAIFNGSDVPSVRAVQSALKCSWPNAKTAHAHLTEMHQLRTAQLVTAGR